MNVLVVYASKSGWTKDAAKVVAATAERAGHEPVLVDAADMAAVNDADVVFVGSGVRAGKWNPNAIGWLRAHRDRLREVPLALFTVCLSAADTDGAGHDEAEHYVDPVLQSLSLAPQHQAVFAGGYDPKRVSMPERALLAMMKRNQVVDHTDPEAVAAWTTRVLEDAAV